MPIDREATLKKAEKLLRQGKLDGAIAEYVRLVEDHPKDWNSINALGDLYVRAGQTDLAVAQFTRVADHLHGEGFLPKAAALYKKALRINPDDEHTLIRLAEIATGAGVLVDAKNYYRRVAEKRRQRGDEKGATEITIRLGEIDPADADAKVQAARAAQTLNDTARACALLTEAADVYEKQGRAADALAALAEAVALDPDDDPRRTRLLSGLVAQGEIAQARSVARSAEELVAIADHLESQGHAPEAVEVLADALERAPDDAALRGRLTRACLESGRLDQARSLARTADELLTIAAALEAQGRGADALDVLTQALELDPENLDLRARLARECIAAGRLDRARALARTADELLMIAETFEQQGRKPEALEVLAQAVQLDPGNAVLRGRVARECIAAGQIEMARRFLTPEAAGDDPALLMALARIELQAGRIEEGRQALNRLLVIRPDRRDELVFVACELADQGYPDAAFACVDLVADAALLEADWGGAAAALHEFVTRVPNQIPALMKLVEICVDGGLESTMFMAQAQLADAYLAAGLGAEARVIAEDLVAREPWVRANIERFRRALMMLGVPNPDAVIAERLSGESPFQSTIDLEGADGTAPPTAAPPPNAPVEAAPAVESKTLEVAALPEPPPAAALPELSEDMLASSPAGTFDESPAEDSIVMDAMEIDLTDALSGLDGPAAASVASSAEANSPRPAPLDRASALQEARAQYDAGIQHADEGRSEQAIAALEAASRVPVMRFQAAARLARLHVARGDLSRAVDWFEQASQAPPPTVEDGFALLYEFADALEQVGESTRALAVLFELSADAGDYRDVAARIERLSKVQAGR